MKEYLPLKIWLLVVIIFAFIAGYFIWSQANQPFPFDGKLLVRHQEQQIDTSTWQTYRKTVYGFEFKYPAEFFFVPEPSGLSINFSKDRLDGFTFNVGYLLEFQERTSTLVSEEKLDLDSLRDRLGTEVIGDFTGNPPWGYYIVNIKLSKQNDFGVLGVSLTGRIPNTDTLQYGGEGDDLRLFNQILSTFKFIEPTSESGEGEFCIQVITPARNPQTGEVRDFSTPCDVPAGWEVLR